MADIPSELKLLSKENQKYFLGNTLFYVWDRRSKIDINLAIVCRILLAVSKTAMSEPDNLKKSNWQKAFRFIKKTSSAVK